MRVLLMCLILLGGQMLSRQEKPVVHLRPHSAEISTDFGGDMVQIIDAPAKVYLPDPAPTLDKAGNPWAVDAKNLGPHTVEIMGKGGFKVQIDVGETVHIHSDGIKYSLER